MTFGNHVYLGFLQSVLTSMRAVAGPRAPFTANHALDKHNIASLLLW